jgi:hypothetical protein
MNYTRDEAVAALKRAALILGGGLARRVAAIDFQAYEDMQVDVAILRKLANRLERAEVLRDSDRVWGLKIDWPEEPK